MEPVTLPAVPAVAVAEPARTDALFADTRFAELARLVDSGAYDLLSLDVFDTLVFRRVARPTDVFFLLADTLRDSGALWPSSSRESFVRERVEAERRARDRVPSREVTLAKIWAEFPRGYVRGIDPAVCAGLELEVERRLIAPHADVLALVDHARASGLKVALVSDMYLGADAIRALSGIDADWVIASCEHAVSKYHGLHRVLLSKSGVAPARVLHVGDHELADVEGPKAFQIATYHLAKLPDDYARVVDLEWPSTLSAREALVRTDDAGLTALRGRALFHGADDYERWGAGVLGPVVSGFCDWVVERCADLGVTDALCLMREGRVLRQVLATRTDAPRAHECFVSRFVALQAAILDGTEAELRAFAYRPSPVALGRLRSQLGLDDRDLPGDAARTLEPTETAETIRRIAGDTRLRARVVAHSRGVRTRLLTHLDRALGSRTRGTVACVDLGYTGTIQAALHRIIERERPELRLHGLYLVTGGDAGRTQATGATLEGWLAENGQPVDVAHTFVRSPEIVEQCLMAPCGTTLGHAADGTPVLDEIRVPEAQQQAIAAVQRGLLAWARAWAAHRERLGLADTAALLPLYRAITMRTVSRPLPVELDLFAAWGHDENFGADHVRTLITPEDMHPWELEHLSAHQLASLPHTRLYWPFGLATLLSPAFGEAVNAIYRRAVPPEAFDCAEPARELRLTWDTGPGFTKQQSLQQEYALDSRGRRWQRLRMRVDGQPVRRFGLSIGEPGEVLRFAGVRLHVCPDKGEPSSTTLEPAQLAFEGYRHLHGPFWLCEDGERTIVVPVGGLDGFRGEIELDVFFGVFSEA